jgi:hypothetical protein
MKIGQKINESIPLRNNEASKTWEPLNGFSRKLETEKFHCFTVHFDSLSFIHTNLCTFSYNYALVFPVILKSLKTL